MTVNFKGIKPEYISQNYQIKPISADYPVEQLNLFTQSINSKNFIGSGLNGDAYLLGKNLVIKKTKANAFVEDAVLKEACKLDYLYELDKKGLLNLENSQRGIICFKTPDGDSYLISTFVKGEKADWQKNPLNKRNLKSLMKIFTSFDSFSKYGKRIMSYDYNGSNLKFTSRKAGILDIEYMDVKNIQNDLKNSYKNPYVWSISPHISDTSFLDSNVRSFEFNALYSYLMSMPEEKAYKLFKKYLKLKGKYHHKMEKFYNTNKDNIGMPTEISYIAKKEKNHAQLLSKRKIDPDIAKAEAMKIQMAKLLYDLYNALFGHVKISPNEIELYYKKTCSFINGCLKKSIQNKDISKARYFHDCKTIMNIWRTSLNASRVWVKNYSKTKKVLNKTLDVIVR